MFSKIALTGQVLVLLWMFGPAARAEMVARPAPGATTETAPSVLDDPDWLLGPAPNSSHRSAADAPLLSDSGEGSAARPAVSLPKFDAVAPVQWADRAQDWVAPAALGVGVIVLLLIFRHSTRRRRRRRRYRMLY